MATSDSARAGARLYAINLRLNELSHEMQQTQIRVHHLEAQLEDARLANMVGGEAGDPSTITTELEASRGSLETQQELIDSVKRSQWNARVQYTVAQAKERSEAKARMRAAEAAE